MFCWRCGRPVRKSARNASKKTGITVQLFLYLLEVKERSERSNKTMNLICCPIWTKHPVPTHGIWWSTTINDSWLMVKICWLRQRKLFEDYVRFLIFLKHSSTTFQLQAPHPCTLSSIPKTALLVSYLHQLLNQNSSPIFYLAHINSVSLSTCHLRTHWLDSDISSYPFTHCIVIVTIHITVTFLTIPTHEECSFLVVHMLMFSYIFVSFIFIVSTTSHLHVQWIAFICV